MPEYQFECTVTGNWDGIIKARNKREALKLAKEELELNNLKADGDIFLYRVELGEDY